MPSIGNATLCMDSRGRAREREVKLQFVGAPRNPCVDWRGRAHEREVKLQLLGVTRNPLRGLAWSSARTRGKVATFCNF